MSKQEDSTSSSVPNLQGSHGAGNGGGQKSSVPRKSSHIPSRTSSAPPEEHAMDVKPNRNFEPTKTHQNFVSSAPSDSSPRENGAKTNNSRRVRNDGGSANQIPPVATALATSSSGDVGIGSSPRSSSAVAGVSSAGTGPTPQGVLLNRPGNPAAGASSNAGTPTNRTQNYGGRDRNQGNSGSYSSRSGGRDSRDSRDGRDGRDNREGREGREKDNRRRSGSHQQSQQHGAYNRSSQQAGLRSGPQQQMQQGMHASVPQQQYLGPGQASNRWQGPYGPDAAGVNYRSSPQLLGSTGTPPMHSMQSPIGMPIMGGHQMYGSPSNQGMMPGVGQAPQMFGMQLPPPQQHQQQQIPPRMNMQQQAPFPPNMQAQYGMNFVPEQAMMGQYIVQPDYGGMQNMLSFQQLQFMQQQQQQQYPIMAQRQGPTFVVPNQQVVMHEPIIAQGNPSMQGMQFMINPNLTINQQQQQQQMNPQMLQAGGRYPGAQVMPIMQSMPMMRSDAAAGPAAMAVPAEAPVLDGAAPQMHEGGDRAVIKDAESVPPSSKPKLKYSSKTGEEINLQNFRKTGKGDSAAAEQAPGTSSASATSQAEGNEYESRPSFDESTEIPSIAAQLEALKLKHPESSSRRVEDSHTGLTPAGVGADECFSPPIKVHNLPVSIGSFGVVPPAGGDMRREEVPDLSENMPPTMPVSIPVSVPSAPVSIPSVAVSLPSGASAESADAGMSEVREAHESEFSAETKVESMTARDDNYADYATDGPMERTGRDSIDSQPGRMDTNVAKVGATAGALRSLRPGGGKSNVAIRLNQGPTVIKYSKKELIAYRPKDKPEQSPFPMYNPINVMDQNTPAGNVGGLNGGRGGQWSKQQIVRVDGRNVGDEKDRDGGGWKRGETNLPQELKRGKSRSNIPMPKKVITDPMEILSTEATEILNKITPQTFEKLTARMLELPVKNISMMDKLIQIIFDKAVQDRNFTSMYAELCNILNTQSNWNFFLVAKKFDSSDYFWIKEYSFPEMCAGPFFNAKEYYNAVKAEVLPEMRPMNISSLSVGETLLIDDVLLRAYHNDVTKEYFITYVAFSEFHTDKLSQDVFADEKEAVKSAKNQTSFRARLLNNCQQEYQGNQDADLLGKTEEDRRQLHALRRTITDEEYLAREEEIDERHYKFKNHVLGTIRFVGELYKIGLLTSGTIHTCVTDLLGSQEGGWKTQFDEQDLEVLCQLITSTGAKLELKSSADRAKLDTYFKRLETLSKDKNINSRLRFNIEQVIDLRRNNWQTRRHQEGPLKIDEIHQKIQSEHHVHQQQQLQQQQLQQQLQQQYGYARAGSFNNRVPYGQPQPSNQPKAIMQRAQRGGPSDTRYQGDNRKGGGGGGAQMQGARSQGNTPNARTPSNYSSNQNTPTGRSSVDLVNAAPGTPSTPSSAMKENQFDLSYDFPEDAIFKRARSTINEYFESRDVNEVVEFFEESPVVAVGHFVLHCVSIIVSQTTPSGIDALLGLIQNPLVCSRLQAGKQYIVAALKKCEMLTCLVDTIVDYREAPERIGIIVGILLKYGILSSNEFEQSLAYAKEFCEIELCAPQEDVERVFGRYVHKVIQVRDSND